MPIPTCRNWSGNLPFGPSTWLARVVCSLTLAILSECLVGGGLSQDRTTSGASPRTATIAADYATVHCGPAADAYVTARLPKGETVEVIRLDPDGWFAIRPPAGSHGWVSARFVRPILNAAAIEVRSSQAVAWIGSIDPQDTDLRWQIHLEVGEQLVVLGHETRRTYPEGPIEPHYRIAPPQGELRWVKAAEIQPLPNFAVRTTPVTVRLVTSLAASRSATTPDTTSSPQPQTGNVAATESAVQLAGTTRVEPEAAEPEPGEPEHREPEAGDPDQLPRRPADGTHPGADGFTPQGFPSTPRSRARQTNEQPTQEGAIELAEQPLVAEPVTPQSEGQEASVSPAKRLPKPMTARLVPLTPSSDAGAGEVDRSLEPQTDFQRKLGDLDVQLSLALTKPPLQWPLVRLRQQAEKLMEEASQTLDRARVQLVLETIGESERLQSRFATAWGVAPAAASTGEANATPAGTQPVGTGTLPAPTTRAAASPVSTSNTDAASQAASGPTPNEAFRGSSLPTDAAADNESGTPPPTPLNPRFDGVGWLTQVWSKGNSSPPYALVDAQGQLLQWVSPAPGLNLHRYLRKEVGIFGQRTAQTALEKPHLTAERVVDLARHRR